MVLVVRLTLTAPSVLTNTFSQPRVILSGPPANSVLLFSGPKKCKILHLGNNNPQYDYQIEENGIYRTLSNTKAEKDLGIIIDPDLTFDTHIHNVVKNGNKISGLLVRNIVNKSPEVMVPLFKALVRPVLEYGNSVWNPFLFKHIREIEGVQRRFTKCVVGTANMDYKKRLTLLKLPSLEYRRLRGDLIEVFKITHNYYDYRTTSTLFTKAYNEATRGHEFKLQKTNVNYKKFGNFFTNRIINIWNNLPNDIIKSSSVNSFKNNIDKKFINLKYSTEFVLY